MHVNEAAVLISKDASLGGLHCQLVICIVGLDWASFWREDFVWFKNHQYFVGFLAISDLIRFLQVDVWPSRVRRRTWKWD